MSASNGRHRGPLIALAMALAAIIAVAWIENRPSERSSLQNIGIEHSDHRTQDENAAGVESAPYLGLFTPSDTFAQWIMAILGVVATGISAWAVVLVRDTLDETRRAVKAADDAVVVTREIGQAQTRAYVHIESVFLSYEFGLHPNFSVTIRNVGGSPAMRVRVFARICHETYVATTCQNNFGPTRNPSFAFGIPLQPGGVDTITWRHDYSLNKDQIPEHRNGKLDVYCAVKVEFLDVFDFNREEIAYFGIEHIPNDGQAHRLTSSYIPHVVFQNDVKNRTRQAKDR